MITTIHSINILIRRQLRLEKFRNWVFLLSLAIAVSSIWAILNKGPASVFVWQDNQGRWNWGGKLPSAPEVEFTQVATGLGLATDAPPSSQVPSWQVIGIGAKDSMPYLTAQDKDGNWKWQGKLPNPTSIKFTKITTALGWSSDAGPLLRPALHMIGIGNANRLYRISQNKDGTWHWGGELVPEAPVRFTEVSTVLRFHRGVPRYLEVIAISATDGLLYRMAEGNDDRWHWVGELPNDPKKKVLFNQITSELGWDNEISAPQIIGIGADDGLPYVIWHANAMWNWGGKLPNDPTNPVKFSQVAAGVGNNGHLQVIGIGADDKLPYLIWQDRKGKWSWFGKLPNSSTAPVKFSRVTAGVGNNGNLQVIGMGAEDRLPYRIRQDDSGTWHWGGKLPNPKSVAFTQVVVGANNREYFGDRMFPVVGLGAADHLPYLISEESPSGNWSWVGKLPTSTPVQFRQFSTGVGWTSSPDKPPQQALQIVGIDANDSLLYSIWQGGNGSWSWGGKLPNSPSTPVKFDQAKTGIGNNANLQVVGINTSDKLLYLIWQDSKGNWTWGGKLPNDAVAPVKFTQISTGLGWSPGSGGAPQQALQIIGIGSNDALPYATWQDNQGSWHWGGKMPTSASIKFTQVAAGLGWNSPSSGPPQQALQVIGINSNDSQLYQVWQDTNGNWHWGGKLPNDAATPVNFSQIAAGVGNGGNLQVIGISSSNRQLYLTWQDTNGNWHWGGKLPNDTSTPVGFAQIKTGIGISPGSVGPWPPAMPALQLTGISASDGLPYVTWQDANGNWHWGGKLPIVSGGSKPVTFAQVEMGVGNNGNLQVILTTP